VRLAAVERSEAAAMAKLAMARAVSWWMSYEEAASKTLFLAD
jgi:hypothetical protein